MIKLWRAVSVGRLQTEYAVNRLLIERERERLEEWRRGHKRRDMEEKRKEEMREE